MALAPFRCGTANPELVAIHVPEQVYKYLKKVPQMGKGMRERLNRWSGPIMRFFGRLLWIIITVAMVVLAVNFAISNDTMISLSLWPFTEILKFQFGYLVSVPL